MKERQTRKFEALRNQRPIHTFTALDRKKLVVNVSHRTLSPQEEEVLALGLSFAIAPKQIPYHEIIAATEATSRRLDKPTADALRQAVNGVLQQAKTPRPNMSFQQRRTIQDLKRDETIVILPADKGRATVVMNSEDYTSKMEEILNDDKYRPLRRDPTLTIEKKVTKSLKLLHSDGHISDKLLDQLTPRYSDPPQMYGLPKVHKENIPMRPIVSTIGSPTYRLAKELARILTPLTGKNSYAVKNSAQFVTSLQNVRISPDDQLVSFDVVSLFTQVPIDHALKVVEKRLFDDQTITERTTIPVQQLVQLTELCLRSTYFKCLNKFYEQTDGAAMGSPLSPINANLFMEHLEEEAIQSAPFQPAVWTCYVDDTLVIWQHGEEELARFHQHLNQQSPNIQFTMEREKEGRIAFLDVLVSRDGDHLSTSVYRKPTHTDRYIPFNSHHRPRVLTGVMRGMRNRALQVCDDTSRPAEMQHLEEVFTANGFPEQLVKKTLSRLPRHIEEDNQPEERPTILYTPYIRGTSEKLEKACAPLGVKTVFKPQRTMRQLLVRVKERIPPENQRSSV